MPNATIECRGVWKIFGDREHEALDAIRTRGIGKNEVFDEFGCIVGVRDVSFEVAEGEIFCIMGLSGSGKSTLIRHVNRLIDPSAGEVLVEGVDVNSLAPEALRELRSKKIGMVFQNMALLPHRTVRDNVALGLELRGIDKAARNATAESTLERVELAGWGERYPDELSGGMKQRVGLARALAADPHILLMDEPFSALDPLIRRELQREFMTLASQMNKTTLFITHDLDEAIRIGRRIAIMKDGMFVQIGTPEDIVTNPKDDYVADFVAGISKLNLVTARKIMESPQAYAATHGPVDEAACPTAVPDDSLDRLVDLATGSRHPIVVVADGETVGIVTNQALLRGIRGRRPASGPPATAGGEQGVANNG